MKYLFAILFPLISQFHFSQEAKVFMENGMVKHQAKDYQGAIKDYSKAIKQDKNYSIAYFNRGTCELAIQDYKSAKKDFDKAIETDPNFAKAYYSRASISILEKKYLDALPYLDKVVEIEPATPNALTLRGQIRSQTGNKNGGCEDFEKAKAIGDTQAENYIKQFCADFKSNEKFVLDWPENWVGSKQENDKMILVEFVASNETLDKWTEIGTMTTLKGMTNISLDDYKNLLFQQSKKNSSKAELVVIEKNESSENPWIIFTIEAPNFKNNKNPESQLWFVIQGKDSLYSNFRAVKKATIPNELKDKWIAFFKNGRIVH